MMSRTVKLVNGKVKFEGGDDPANETFEDRFKTALKNTRKRGVKVRQNVRECCRSCVDLDKLGLTDWESTPFVWTYGGQGSAYRWGEDGYPYSYPTRWSGGEVIERMYFNHGGPGTEGATILAEELKAQGIKVDWKKTEGHCVEVIVQKDSVLTNR